MNDALTELKKALEGTDTDVIRTSAEKLATVSQKMGSAIYAQGQQAGGGDGAPQDATPGQEQKATDDDVVEAEIVDEDQPKKDQ